MHNIYLFQPQYTSIFNGEKTYWIPYSIGCLWSYVKQFEHIDKNFECPELFFKRDNPKDIIAINSLSLLSFIKHNIRPKIIIKGIIIVKILGNKYNDR